MQSTCPGSRAIKQLKPEYVRCPHCHTEVEVWNDEFRARCPECKAWVFRAQGVTCLDWCSKAEECVGSATLANYRRAREHAS